MLCRDMSRSTRLFEILQILRQAKSPVTAQSIAESLEVTKRTVYRDMAALQAMRLPIEGEAGIGYVLRAGFDLPPLMFTAEELEAIAVGLALLGRTRDRGLEQAALRAASKISDVLPETAPKDIPLHVSRWSQIPEAQIDTGMLRRRIREEAELSITYLDLSNHRSWRKIRPIALVYYIDVVVLAAWCQLRQGFRHFCLDRIEDCKPTGAHFEGQSARLRQAWEQEGGLP